ncbi:MAG: DUF1801 domain-containing protein [Clostridiales bacterium]|jgi:uncharacterized protein YdhG (YjbR/CyaY superfamily)|nr:DUF1801 domain-containing protein [Clostridiales bacterium]
MWKCAKCGREFKAEGQHHFCSAPINTVDEYIAQFQDDKKAVLEKVRAVIHEVAPRATEKMAWRMPTFWQGENIVHFAAMKNHLGFYPGENGVEHFKDSLTEYRASKGAIQFPYTKPIPYDLIAEITKFRVAEVESRKTK